MEKDSIILICSIIGVGITVIGTLVKLVNLMSTMMMKVDTLMKRDEMNTKVLFEVQDELKDQGNRITRLETTIKKD